MEESEEEYSQRSELGSAKLLKIYAAGKVGVALRHDNTNEIVGNFIVMAARRRAAETAAKEAARVEADKIEVIHRPRMEKRWLDAEAARHEAVAKELVVEAELRCGGRSQVDSEGDV